MRERRFVSLYATVAFLYLSFPVIAVEPIQSLDSWKAQRDGFERYRDEQQKQVDFDRKALERTRELADEGARQREFMDASKAVMKGAPGALKDAFKDAVSGKMSLKVAKDTFSRAQK